MQLFVGDCLDVLKDFEACSIDSIVTDPPYGISYFNRRWDYDVPSVDIWAECLRVLKPGAHLLAFSGTRTQHRMVTRIEDAGFEIRDSLAWIYGSGFPKSYNLGNEEQTREWTGWGTALKPAMEPIVLARKPLSGTIAQNVLSFGTGALNIGASKIQDDNQTRWPANVLHDGSEQVVNVLGDASRFFYCAKASRRDREEGCDDLPVVHQANGNKWTDVDYRMLNGERATPAEFAKRRNYHPTVKPTSLMRYLCRLVTPPNGIILDPFMGSGSTGKAAVQEQFRFVGIERDENYVKIASARISHASREKE